MDSDTRANWRISSEAYANSLNCSALRFSPPPSVPSVPNTMSCAATWWHVAMCNRSSRPTLASGANRTSDDDDSAQMFARVNTPNSSYTFSCNPSPPSCCNSRNSRTLANSSSTSRFCVTARAALSA
eukprot:3936624-Rhodomonas_salina.2